MKKLMKQTLFFAAVMVAIVAALAVLVLFLVNKGFISGFWWMWLKSWLMGYLAAAPTVLIIAPLVQSFLNRLVKSLETESCPVQPWDKQRPNQ